MEKLLKGLCVLSLFLMTPAMAIVGGTTIDGVLPHYLTDYDRSEMASHTVALINMHHEGEYDVCSSTLIADDVLLTAAHCVKTDVKHLQAVFSDRTFAVYDRIPILKVIAHPKYTKGLPFKDDPNYDLALVLLSSPAPVLYKPAEVLSKFVSRHERFWAYVAGYGATSTQSSDQGQIRFSRVTFSDYTQQSKTSYLEGEQQKTEGICRGDSGGPVFVKLNNEFKLIGVTSMQVMIPDNCRGTPYFNYVPYFKEWIDKTLEDLRL